MSIVAGDMFSDDKPSLLRYPPVRSGRRPADRYEDRRPHGLQDHSEYLHAVNDETLK